MERVLLEDEQKISRSEIAEKLVKISEGVEKGEINLTSGEDQVELHLNEICEFEIKVEEEGDELSLELEIEWNQNKEESEKGVEIS
jgi:hypothetical protein